MHAQVKKKSELGHIVTLGKLVSTTQRHKTQAKGNKGRAPTKNKPTKTDTFCQSLLKCTVLDLLLLQWNK